MVRQIARAFLLLFITAILIFPPGFSFTDTATTPPPTVSGRFFVR